METSGIFFAAATYLGGFLICLILIGVPVGVALAASSFLFAVLYSIPIALITAPILQVFGAEYWFAIPALILAGNLQREAGGSDRVWRFLTMHLGRSKKGMAISTMITGLFYPDYDGDGITLRNELATDRVKELQEAGFGTKASLRLVSAISALRLLTPPSILLILVGFLISSSIYEIFIEAIAVALIAASLIFLLILIYVRGQSSEEKLKDFRPSRFVGALPWLVGPFIVVGSLGIGLLTPAEMGVFAACYFMLIGIIQRSLSAKRILRASVNTLQSCGSIFFVLVFAVSCGRILIMQGQPTMMLSPWGSAVVIMLVSAASCMLMGPVATSVISAFVFGRIFAGDASQFEIGLAIILGIAVGSIVPPFGSIFIALTQSTKERFGKLAKEGTAAFMLPLLLPSLLVILGVILLVANA